MCITHHITDSVLVECCVNVCDWVSCLHEQVYPGSEQIQGEEDAFVYLNCGCC